VPPTISQSLSPEGHDSMEAYDLAGAPLTPSRGLRGILHQIAANQAETERRLRTPPQLRAQAPQPVTAAVSEQLGSVRRPMSATATPSAIRVEVNSPNPFFMSPTPPASRNASQSQKSTPHQSRASLLPVISENPRAVTQKSTGAPSLQMFVGAAR
jgi:hypothetical protein